MIVCPKCQQSLPDWSKNCQFCGSDVKQVARPVAAPKKLYDAFIVPQWIWTVYYVIAGWWILNGAFDILNGLFSFGVKPEDAEINIVSIIGGSISALIGIGLALKIEFIRGIVNFFSGLKLLFGVIRLAALIMSMAIFGALAIPLILLTIVDIITAVMMIYLIGETDKQARI